MAEHITIGDVAPRVQYVADGVLADFTYPFPIFEEADLDIRLDGAVLTGGVTITGAGNSNGGSGAAVTLLGEAVGATRSR